MIVDTSALLAILLGEPEADDLTLAIGRAEAARLSAASYVEAGIRVDQSKNPIAQDELDDLIKRLGIAIEPVSVEQAYAARAAYRAYGKRNHPAGLNYGDCFAYALAKATGEPLLFKGDDFARTGVEAAL